MIPQQFGIHVPPQPASASAGAVLQVPYRSRNSWHAGDLVDATDWCIQLSAADVAELDSALRAAQACSLPILRLESEHFPLPNLAARLRQVATSLDGGLGFAAIRGIPAEHYGEADLRTILWGIGQHLGIPVSQNAYGHMLGTVRPSAATEKAAPLTSAGSDVTAVLGLGSGNRSVVVSSAAIFNEILAGWPHLAERLFRTYHLDRRGDQPPGERPYRAVPLACWFDGKLSIRYSRHDIDSAQRYSGVPGLDSDDLALLDLVDELLGSARLRFEVDLRPGEIHLFNNYAVLHAQTHVSSRGRAATDLLELWLTLRHGRALPSAFTWLNGRGGRGEVTPRDVVMPTGIGRSQRP
ncbi:TauD/TfdA family dioxygenase [Rhodococcus pseudokoreensis]|jgi:hypothetical protein|uniref:TauD/TfdA family dioxygenase n=1 Tax=Rhodococcus pseudokoreensis TaxID=2811421 RepID=A0A974ZXK0_9NOCA|nr:TauD/TfdA family dioxygenase [Rhodococcus pseudokoreensis]QSE93746.1 TauD/TfdA family dioxygenase [Rhodococcus pseudokoreensis]